MPMLEGRITTKPTNSSANSAKSGGRDDVHNLPVGMSAISRGSLEIRKRQAIARGGVWDVFVRAPCSPYR